MNHEANGAYLELLAAKAKQLAEDYKRGRLWEGDLSRGLRELQETLNKIDTRTDR